MTTLKIGSVEVEMTAIPEGNLAILAQRSLNHIFNNERDAAVPAEKFNGDAAALEAARRTWEEAKRALVLSGVLGTRSGGPRLSPVEKEYNQLVLKTCRAQFAAFNKKHNLSVKFPSKMDEEFQLGVLKRTLRQMLANVEAQHGEKLKAQATKNVAEASRAAERAAAAVEGTEADPSAMGL